MEVDVFIPCSIDQFYPQTANNLITLLTDLGHKVNYNSNQTCCGRILYENGNWKEAKVIGEKFINDFNIRNYIVGCSTSCIGYVKGSMKELFHNTSNHNKYKQIKDKIMDISEFLVDTTQTLDIGAWFPYKVALHHNCHSINEYNLTEEVKLLLQNVRDLELVDDGTEGICCGYGGGFALFNEPLSMFFAKEKVEKAMTNQAEYIVSGDMSCLIHLQSYIDKYNLPLKTIHIVDLLSRKKQDIKI